MGRPTDTERFEKTHNPGGKLGRGGADGTKAWETVLKATGGRVFAVPTSGFGGGSISATGHVILVELGQPGALNTATLLTREQYERMLGLS